MFNKIVQGVLMSALSLPLYAEGFDPLNPNTYFMHCEYHPNTPQFGFCVINLDSDMSGTKDYFEYKYINGELELFDQVSQQTYITEGMYFSPSGDLMVHVVHDETEVLFNVYEALDFFNGREDIIHTFSEYSVARFISFEDDGEVVYEQSCSEGGDVKCIKSFNIYTPDQVKISRQ